MPSDDTKPRPIKSYRDLDVWSIGMDLAAAAYEIARKLPKEELFALSAQIRRASSSIPANIAEGYGRQSSAELARFLRISQGSLRELETHLLLAVRVGMLRDADITEAMDLCSRAGRMLYRFLESIEEHRRP